MTITDNRIITSRFAALNPRQSILALAIIASMILLSLWPTSAHVSGGNGVSQVPIAQKADLTNDDLRLYRQINSRIASGTGYYAAAFAEQRINAYPTKPFVTVRFPTLAIAVASIGPQLAQLLLVCGAFFTLYIWHMQLAGAFRDPGRRVSAVMLIASGLIMAVMSKYVVLHELWAGMLIAISLGLYQPSRYWPAVIAAALALAVRETALPFILLMSAFALFERRWREAAVWSILIVAFALGLYWHATVVISLAKPDDVTSLGWAQFGGWNAAITAMEKTSALRILPSIFATVFIPLSLFGWLSWRSGVGLRGTLYLAGYGIMLMLVGRPDNFYWGLMVTPLLLLGLAFLPQALLDIALNLGWQGEKKVAGPDLFHTNKSAPS